MSKQSRVRLATDEDLERDFPDGFMIGLPVRPAADDSAEPAAEEEQPPSS